MAFLGLTFIAGCLVLILVWFFFLFTCSATQESNRYCRAVLRLTLFCVGIEIFIVGILQVILGRGVVWPIADRHAFFPLLGLYFSSILVIFEIIDRRLFEKALASKVILVVAVILSTRVWVARCIAVNTHFESQQARKVQKQWTKFFSDLDIMLCETTDKRKLRRTFLPDLPVSELSGRLSQIAPFTEGGYGFSLSYLARMGQSACYDNRMVKFMTPEFTDLKLWQPLCDRHDSSSCRFFRKHFPEFYKQNLKVS